MERIVNFGSFTVNQQLDLLENRLKKGDILLFPDYEEYHACAMRIVKVIEDKNGSLKEGSLIEINYHNYPQQIYKRRSM